MQTKFFIHPHEKLLIEQAWNDGKRVFGEALNGPLTFERAREEFAQDGNEVRALRLDPVGLNVEDVTEDLVPEPKPEEPFWADEVRMDADQRHERSFRQPVL